MRLIKPSWVTHDGFPIFSLDVHPDGTRFATGGQGAGDSGRVVIWNMAPVIDEAQEAKENVPKYLSRMDNHLNCVNCVRWSVDGKYLASGGDDKVIMVWQMARINHATTNHASSFSSSAFGGSNVETYRCVATLRGHSGDILDMNWSPVEARLASCSIDNSIIIWNTSRWVHEHTITGHTGLVKGVSWDPIGKYLASQSDDKSLKIWRTSDWKEDHCLTEPFVECGGTTHVLRLNWSPDGQQLVSAHAMNNCGSVAQIIDRENWTANRDFVGHRKAVTCVRFNPVMFKKKKDKSSNKKDKEQIFSCVAVGSRDRSVSVWMTCLPRPLVVVHELFSNSVLDTSWSPDGLKLLACSWDGSVACLDFEPSELGSVLSGDETHLYLEKLYGKMTKSKESNHVLIEDIDIIKAREERERKASMKASTSSPTNGHQSHQQESMSYSINNDSRSNTSSRLLKGPTDKQIEVKLVNGKRRITPLYIPPPMDLDGIPLPYNHQEINFSTSTDQKSRIPIERREDSSNISFTSPTSKGERPDKFTTPKVTSPHESTTPKGSKRKTDPSRGGDVSPVAKRKPGRPPGSTRVSSQENRSEPPSRQEVAQNEPIPSRHQPVQSLPPPTTSSVKTTIKRSESRKNRIQLTGLSIEKSASFPLPNNQVIEVENNVRNTAVCILRLISRTSAGDDSTNWEVILTSKITAVTACDFMSAVVTEDNLVSVFSTKTGRRLHLPIVLNAPVSRIDSANHYLMLITVDGRLSVYDFNSHSSVVRNESLVSLFNDSGQKDSTLTITYSEITANGTPIISLSSKKSFIFDPSFKHWSLLSNPADLLNCCSDLKPTGHRSDPNAFPLARIQAITSRGLRPGTNIFSSNSQLQSKATISYIDQQLAASFVVGSKAEYKFWLLALAQALADAGVEDRLRELCSFLLGPIFQDSDWSSTILGHEKRSLLNEVLSIMTSNLKLQRLYTEFKDQIAFSQVISTSDPLMNDAFRGQIKEKITEPPKNQPCIPAIAANTSLRQEIRMETNESASSFITLNHKAVQEKLEARVVSTNGIGNSCSSSSSVVVPRNPSVEEKPSGESPDLTPHKNYGQPLEDKEPDKVKTINMDATDSNRMEVEEVIPSFSENHEQDEKVDSIILPVEVPMVQTSSSSSSPPTTAKQGGEVEEAVIGETDKRGGVLEEEGARNGCTSSSSPPSFSSPLSSSAPLIFQSATPEATAPLNNSTSPAHSTLSPPTIQTSSQSGIPLVEQENNHEQSKPEKVSAEEVKNVPLTGLGRGQYRDVRKDSSSLTPPSPRSPM